MIGPRCENVLLVSILEIKAKKRYTYGCVEMEAKKRYLVCLTDVWLSIRRCIRNSAGERAFPGPGGRQNQQKVYLRSFHRFCVPGEMALG